MNIKKLILAVFSIIFSFVISVSCFAFENTKLPYVNGYGLSIDSVNVDIKGFNVKGDFSITKDDENKTFIYNFVLDPLPKNRDEKSDGEKILGEILPMEPQGRIKIAQGYTGKSGENIKFCGRVPKTAKSGEYILKLFIQDKDDVLNTAKIQVKKVKYTKKPFNTTPIFILILGAIGWGIYYYLYKKED